MSDSDESQKAALNAALAQIDRAFGKGSSEVRTLPATMTERVARELCRFRAGNEHVDKHWRDFIDEAQAVFGVMLQPTDEMLDECEASKDRDEYQDLLTAREQIEHIWQVMLTTAEYELDPDELERRARQAKADQEWRDAGCPTSGDDPPF